MEGQEDGLDILEPARERVNGNVDACHDGWLFVWTGMVSTVSMGFLVSNFLFVTIDVDSGRVSRPRSYVWSDLQTRTRTVFQGESETHKDCS